MKNGLIGGTPIMICPKCGEENSETFRFCGMCGTPLEARRPAGAPRVPLPADAARPNATPVVEPISSPGDIRSRASVAPARAISSPSANVQAARPQESFTPDLDSLRSNSFSSLDSFFEPDPSESSYRRIFMLLILLAALGGAGWWAYSNYLGATGGRGSQPTAQVPAPSETSVSKPSETAATTPEPVKPSTESTANVPAPEKTTPKQAEAELPNPESANPTTPSAKLTAKTTAPQKAAPRPSPKSGPAKSAPATASPATVPVSGDPGDADYKKGVAYLYGRGVPENCDQALKYLRSASAKENAKARSTFGTMYATGHCVPRDLPTSYSWFALALRADPGNQILEKDLTAVWNQMTPPERQTATRIKP